MLRTLALVLLVLAHCLFGLPMVAAQTRTLAVEARSGQPKRLALVVGVDAYQSVSALRNAVADAETMAGTLNRVGYEVRVVHNPAQRDLQDEIVAFTQRLQGGDEVIFFFSGHGVQMGGLNYLLPKDVRGQSDAQVRNDAIALNALLDDLRERKPRFTLAIIDACRDNPFQGTGRNIGGRGLARVTGAEGQMIIYAAGEGQQALDRLGANDPVRNGLFTRVFASQMTRPGVPVHDVLRTVRDEVYRLAQGVGHTQVPAIYDQMLGSFYFVPPPAGAGVAVGPATSLASRPAPAAPAAGGLSLDDLEREERARREWTQWQQRMQADFERVASFQGSPDLQAQAWQRFLQTWAQDNPTGRDDEALRQQAQARLEQSQRAAQAAQAATQVAALAPARPVQIPAPISSGTVALPARWPSGPITFVVPFAAGGPTDRVARDLAEAMRKHLGGAAVVVENVGGAGGTLGAAKVAKAAPDGQTFLLHHIGMATAPALYRTLAYRPVDDFEFVGLVNEVPMVLLGRPGLAASSFAELRRWIEANRGRVTMANAGLGSASHLCGLAMQQALRIDLSQVPYKGTAPALTDLMGGQVDLMCEQATNALSLLDGRRVKAFAVTTQAAAWPALASLPTFQSLGIGDAGTRIWHGLYAPRGTPAAMVEAMNAALRLALRDDEFLRKSQALGAMPITDERVTPAGHRRFVQSELAQWGPVIRAAGQFAD